LTISESAQTVAKILDVVLFGFVDQHIPRVDLSTVIANLRDEACLGHVEVAASFRYFFSRLIR
jgi:hypothetical protein